MVTSGSARARGQRAALGGPRPTMRDVMLPKKEQMKAKMRLSVLADAQALRSVDS